MNTVTVEGPAPGRAARAGRSGRSERSGRSRTARAAPSVVLSVRPAPRLDPPFDDLAPPIAGMDLLPLDWSGSGPARRRRAPAPRPPASTAREQRVPDRADATGQVMPGRAALQRYVAMCVEVLNGYRPPTHLRPVTDPARFNDVADQLVRRAVRVRMSPGQAARHGKLVRVRRMIVNEPLDGVAEAAVVLEQGDSCWAMAVRMERVPLDEGRSGWRCMVVQVV